MQSSMQSSMQNSMQNIVIDIKRYGCLNFLLVGVAFEMTVG